MKYELTAEVVKTVMEAPFIVVADIETTGFSGSYEDIIEIGAVLLDTQQHKIAVDKDGKALRFDRIVKPLRRKNIPQKIEALTGVTNEMARKEGISRNQALEEFYHFIGDYPIAFHNAPFDWDRFLSRDFLAIGKAPKNFVFCTLAMAKALYPDQKTYNLEVMSEKFGSPMVGHHRAWVDSKYTAAILLHMKDDLKNMPELPQEQETLLPKEDREPILVTSKFNVYSINGWKKGVYDRIYVATSAGTVYYDRKKDIWAVKDLRQGKEIDLTSMTQALLDKLGITLGEFSEKYKAA